MKNWLSTTTGITVGCIAIGLIVASIFIVGSITRGTADFRGKTDEINKVQGNGTFRIAAYDHFFDLCGSAKTVQQNIETTKTAIKALTAAEKYRQQTNLQAQTNNLNELVTSTTPTPQDRHRGPLQGLGLPAKLDTTQEITCAA
jgi:hypothetical protein